MDFNISVWKEINLFGVDIWITESIVNTWIIMAVLIVGALILRHLFFKNAQAVPVGVQNAVEAGVEMMQKFAGGELGKNLIWLDTWFFGIIVFIAACNLSGLFGLRNPTADAATTLALSTSSFVLINVLGFRADMKSYLKGYLEPFFLFLPVNIISAFSVIVSLGFRLFGNILSGVIISGLLYSLLPWFATLVWPAALHAYFDVFAGLLQAYIFTMLSMAFIKDKVGD
ncbi:F0F1 ATP synthase subunit A [Tyzzerella sp. OttesenSCG-928-J15]|nr:F0F1 ATP synthase subunit A [Tyzzerella sp. OttesenSCG-928-J15]